MTAILLVFLPVVAPASPETQLQIVATPVKTKGVLIVTVTAGREGPLAHANIVLRDRNGQSVMHGTTDEHGVANISGLNPTRHGSILAAKEGYGPVIQDIVWQPVGLRFRLGKGKDLAPTKPFKRSTVVYSPMIRAQRQVLTYGAETCSKREMRYDPFTGGYYEAQQPYTVYRPVWSATEVWERVVPQTQTYYSAPCVAW